MAGLLLQDRPAELKLIIALVVLGCVVGCGKSESAQAAPGASADPFVQKLQSLPESERAEYARTHAAEAVASGGGKMPATTGQ